MCFAVPCEDYEVNPVLGARHGHDLHPARRPRAERLDLDGAARELVGRQPLRLHRGRHRQPVGPGAWRRQRGGAQHLRRDRHARTACRNIIAKAKDKNDPFRLSGFGHRVYKSYDPRAKVMQKTCHEVLDELGINDRLLEVAMELERIALSDEYFIERKLYPNVDFYSGITLRALGFPNNMLTVLFAVARTVGWVAQWNEMVEDETQRIGRPRQLYTGATLGTCRRDSEDGPALRQRRADRYFSQE